MTALSALALGRHTPRLDMLLWVTSRRDDPQDRPSMPIPVIGLVGGIGAGKSHLATIFARLGCAVIDSDQLAREAYEDEHVVGQLRQRWGTSILTPRGRVDRSEVARLIFSDDEERRWLESIVHPWIEARRTAVQGRHADAGTARAFVWDAPLLIEAGLHRRCQAVVLVDTPPEVRRGRVARRGWDKAELARREAVQLPLEDKRALCTDIIDGTASEADLRRQALAILDRLTARSASDVDPGQSRLG